MDNLKYLIKNTRVKKDYIFEDLVYDLPEKSFMYAGIAAFAKLLGVREINENVIQKFFGGKFHIDFTAEQVDMLQLRKKKGLFAEKFMIAHILLPIKITKLGREVSGVYKNNGMIIKFDNFIIHPDIDKSSITIGRTALIHYATVVDVIEDKKIIKWFLSEQLDEIFKRDALKIKKIDYADFWNLKEWTMDLMKKCYG